MKIGPTHSYLASRVEYSAVRPADTPSSPVTPVRAKSASAIPTDAPQGTDHRLWSVLTSEERSYFDRASTARRVTYGRAGLANALASVRGHSLDLTI